MYIKTSAFIFFLAIMQVSSTTFAQQVTIKAKDAPLSTILQQIRIQTGYDFVYTTKTLESARPVTIDVKNEELKDVLKKIFVGQPLEFTIQDKIVTVATKRPLGSDNVAPARFTVSGKVTNELGDPMQGVTIHQKSTLRTTLTDAKGIYSLPISDEKVVIVFTFVGYEPQELSARDIPPGSVIILKPAPQSIQEVVINKGYYSEKRALSTGDVAVVTSREIEEQPVTDPIQALIGRVAGLNIQQTSGIPGSYAAINIRGINSLANGNDPFYVVDGVPFNPNTTSSPYFSSGALGVGLGALFSGNNSQGTSGGGGGLSPFNVLNPADIESIEILKDADATAIYGSRGANGVILITTKKGRSGDTRVNLDVSQGIGQVNHFMDLLNTQQYLQMMHQAFTNDGLPFPNINTNPSDINYDIDGFWDTTRYTNWQKVLIGGTAQYTNAQASISGGTANTQFLVGAGYTRSTTVYPGDYGDQKASLHFNLNHASTNQKFHLQLTGLYGYESNVLPTSDFASDPADLSPDAPALYNPNGTLNWAPYGGTGTWSNPLSVSVTSVTQAVNNLNASLDLGYQLMPGLVIKSDFGYNRNENNEMLIAPASSSPPPYNTNPLNRGNVNGLTTGDGWIIEPQISYHRKIGSGDLNVVVGGTLQQQNSNAQGFRAVGFPSDALIRDPQAASEFSPIGFSSSLDRYDAVLARAGYTWAGKYLLNLTANRDGSSRFGPGRQFGNFGAVGAGWIFSKEKAVEGAVPWLSFGKLRASYGTTGNYQIGYYQFMATYSPPVATFFGPPPLQSYQGVSLLSPNNVANPDFSWETDKKLEGGLELGFLKDRVNVSVSYYRNRSGNQLISYALPEITGFTGVEQNFPAVVQNTGVEITLHTINVKTRDFSWSTSVNFTDPRNKLISFPGIMQSSYAYTYAVGQSLFARQLFQYTGVDPKTGLYTFKTANSNGIPTSPQDDVWSRPVTQNYYGGMGNDFTWKNFSLDIFIQVVNEVGFNYKSFFPMPGTDGYNQPTAVLGAWQTPGQMASVQQFSTYNASNAYNAFQQSTGELTNNNFVKIKNVALSYHLPAGSLRGAHLQNFRVYVQGQNLYTFAHYIGYDPETPGTGLPPLRVITAGISASF
jgi:TonB-linked SusC/RagA family outer membrane protein